MEAWRGKFWEPAKRSSLLTGAGESERRGEGYSAVNGQGGEGNRVVWGGGRERERTRERKRRREKRGISAHQEKKGMTIVVERKKSLTLNR